MRAININVLQRLKYDYESYKENADELEQDKYNTPEYNYWRGKAQGVKEVIDMLECNVVEDKDLWKL